MRTLKNDPEKKGLQTVYVIKKSSINKTMLGERETSSHFPGRMSIKEPSNQIRNLKMQTGSSTFLFLHLLKRTLFLENDRRRNGKFMCGDCQAVATSKLELRI